MIRFNIDTSRFNAAMKEFARYSKKDGKEILLDQARNFVRRVVALTPPARGSANNEAKKRGEATIAKDLSRIMKPAKPEFIQFFERVNGGPVARELFGNPGAAALGFIYTRVLSKGELVGWHEDRRRKDGKVMQVNRDATTGLRVRDLKGLDMGLVDEKTYQWFKKRVQGRVGLLASGWNDAAQTLGYRPPQWIRRHGNSRGHIEITLGNNIFRIRVSNDVKFTGNVKDFERRVQSALNQQTEAMERRVAYFTEKSAKKSGFKTR